MKSSEGALKMEQLETEIENSLLGINPDQRGCIGTLLYSPADPECGACKDFEACGKMPRDEKLADANMELEKIVTDYELEVEMSALNAGRKEMAKVVSKPKPSTEAKPSNVLAGSIKSVLTEIKSPADLPKTIEEIDLSDFGKRTKIAFDFNKAKDMILTEMPGDYKQVRKICLGLVPDPVEHASTAYNNANKIMKHLEQLGAVRWNDESKSIEYPIKWR